MSQHLAKLNFLLLSLILMYLGCKKQTASTESRIAVNNERADIPKFDGTDTLEFVNEVRRFVAAKATAGNVKHPVCLKFDSIPIQAFPVGAFLNIFDSLQGTATCGLTATIMAKILIDNGIDAYTYNFGFEGTKITHVVNLIKHGSDYLVYDAHTNFELLDSSERNLGLLALLEGIKANNIVPTYNSDTVLAKFILDTTCMSDREKTLLHSHDFSVIGSTLKPTRNEILLAEYGRCLDCTLNPMGVGLKKRFEQQLKDETGFDEFHEAFVLKIGSVYGASDADSVDRLIDNKLIELGLR